MLCNPLATGWFLCVKLNSFADSALQWLSWPGFRYWVEVMENRLNFYWPLLISTHQLINRHINILDQSSYQNISTYQILAYQHSWLVKKWLTWLKWWSIASTSTGRSSYQHVNWPLFISTVFNGYHILIYQHINWLLLISTHNLTNCHIRYINILTWYNLLSIVTSPVNISPSSGHITST